MRKGGLWGGGDEILSSLAGRASPLILHLLYGSSNYHISVYWWYKNLSHDIILAITFMEGPLVMKLKNH